MHIDNEFPVLLIKCKLNKGRNLVCHIHYWIFLSSKTISDIWKRFNSIWINAWFFLSLMVNPVYLPNLISLSLYFVMKFCWFYCFQDSILRWKSNVCTSQSDIIKWLMLVNDKRIRRENVFFIWNTFEMIKS